MHARSAASSSARFSDRYGTTRGLFSAKSSIQVLYDCLDELQVILEALDPCSLAMFSPSEDKVQL
jgi:hypothetical protein